MAEEYPSISPYVYCAGNPISLIDPQSLDWYETNEGTVRWTTYSSQKELEANNIEGIYRGKVYVVFKGSRQERLGSKNGKSVYIDGDGAVTATVTVYGDKGEDDIYLLKGYTMSSDARLFGAIDEGVYDANYDSKGKSGNLSSHWVLNNRGPIRMIDGRINPYHPNQIDDKGEGFKTGIFIHSTNANGYAGINGPVSAGCLLLAPEDFRVFNKILSGYRNFKVAVYRSVLEKKPLIGVTGEVPNTFIPILHLKTD